jgi:hypothetical protein
MIKVLGPAGAVSLLLLPFIPVLGPALAQSNEYTIQPPGRPPTNVKPQTGNDGFMIQVPGHPPLYAKPKPDGTYSVDIPGHPPATMTPRPGGGFVIQNPGRPPTYINPGG